MKGSKCMDPFHQYIEEFTREAIENSDGTPKGISEYLWAKKDAGRFARNRDEKNKALQELRRAFDEYRHWPLSIILSHLGIENKEELLKK
jgi:hypothetical protein